MKVVFPGSFDPLTLGHMDIIKKASILFDELIVLLAINKEKERKNKYFFSKEDRLFFLKDCLNEYNNVIIDSFDYLLVDYVKKYNIDCIIRGLRDQNDLNYEINTARINQVISKTKDKDIGIQTIFLIPSADHTHISSSLVKEIVNLGGNLNNLVPKSVLDVIIVKNKKNI